MYLFPYFDTSGGMLNNVNQSIPTDLRTSGPSLDVGQLGGIYEFDETTALNISDTTVGTLLAGRYQLVKLLSTSGTPAVGQVAFVNSRSGFIVTATAGGATDVTGEPAGLFVNALTPGNIGFVLIGGYGLLKYGTIARTGDAIVGNLVHWDVAGSIGTGNVTEDATAVLPLIARRQIFSAIQIAADNETKNVRLLRDLGFPNRGITS